MKRIEEGGVGHAPITDINRAARHSLNRPVILLHLVRVINVNLDGRDNSILVEIGLCFFQGHEHKSRVIFGHAHFKNGSNLISLNARGHAKGRHIPIGGDQGHRIPLRHAKSAGHANANGNPAFRKAVKIAKADISCNIGQVLQILWPHTAHQGAAGPTTTGNQRLPLKQGQGPLNPGHRGHTQRNLGIVIKPRVHRIDDHMPVHAENFFHQLRAKAIHHRHNNNERHHPQQNADE